MSKEAPLAETPEGVIDGLGAALQAETCEALGFWARSCELYARYFAALAKADGLAAIFAANAELLACSLETLVKNSTAMPKPGWPFSPATGD